MDESVDSLTDVAVLDETTHDVVQHRAVSYSDRRDHLTNIAVNVGFWIAVGLAVLVMALAAHALLVFMGDAWPWYLGALGVVLPLTIGAAWLGGRGNGWRV